MKSIITSLFLLLIFWGCTPKSHCTLSRNYLSKIDTTKPYNIKGLYCISAVKDTSLQGDKGVVIFHVFDRITGRKLDGGVVWLIKGDTTKIYFGRKDQLPEGVYRVSVSGVDNVSLKIEKLNIVKNRIYEINCFLGNSMSF